MKKIYIFIFLYGCTSNYINSKFENEVNLRKINIEYTDSTSEFMGESYVFQHYKHLFYSIDSKLIDSTVSKYLDSFVTTNPYIIANFKRNQRFEVYILFSNDCLNNPNLNASKLMDDCLFDDYKARKYFWGNFGTSFHIENFNTLNPDFDNSAD